MGNSRNRYSNVRNAKKVKKQKKLISMLLIIMGVILLIFAGTMLAKNKEETIPVDASLEQKNESEIATENNGEEKNNKEENNMLPPTPVDTKIKITAIGDVMCHNTQFQDAYNKEEKDYDFNYVFESVKKYTRLADITIGNLETTFAGEERGYTGYPTFNTPETLGNALQNMGVDILTTANNHSLDKGYTGLESTLDKLDAINMSHTGTARSEEERNKILIKSVKGAQIAFLNYTYGTNGIPVPTDKKYCINLIDKDLMKADIEKAKEQKADIIIVSMHWGQEYQTTPNAEQKNLEKFLFENGVDIILGSHPHVLQPLEEKTITTLDGEEKNVFVAYSLGNFISGQTAKNTNLSIILNIELTKSVVSGKVSITKIGYRPIYMLNKGNNVTHRFAILDIYDTIANYDNEVADAVNKATYDKVKQALKDIHKIIGDKYDEEKVKEDDMLIIE